MNADQVYYKYDKALRKKLSPQTWGRIRHRHSDARWRANVANCFSVLRKVIVDPNCLKQKRRICKAKILKEAIEHTSLLESTAKVLLQMRANREQNGFTEVIPYEHTLNYYKNTFMQLEQEHEKNKSQQYLACNDCSDDPEMENKVLESLCLPALTAKDLNPEFTYLQKNTQMLTKISGNEMIASTNKPPTILSFNNQAIESHESMNVPLSTSQNEMNNLREGRMQKEKTELNALLYNQMMNDNHVNSELTAEPKEKFIAETANTTYAEMATPKKSWEENSKWEIPSFQSTFLETTPSTSIAAKPEGKIQLRGKEFCKRKIQIQEKYTGKFSYMRKPIRRNVRRKLIAEDPNLVPVTSEETFHAIRSNENEVHAFGKEPFISEGVTLSSSAQDTAISAALQQEAPTAPEHSSITGGLISEPARECKLPPILRLKNDKKNEAMNMAQSATACIYPRSQPSLSDKANDNVGNVSATSSHNDNDIIFTKLLLTSTHIDSHLNESKLDVEQSADIESCGATCPCHFPEEKSFGNESNVWIQALEENQPLCTLNMLYPHKGDFFSSPIRVATGHSSPLWTPSKLNELTCDQAEELKKQPWSSTPAVEKNQSRIKSNANEMAGNLMADMTPISHFSYYNVEKALSFYENIPNECLQVSTSPCYHHAASHSACGENLNALLFPELSALAHSPNLPVSMSSPWKSDMSFLSGTPFPQMQEPCILRSVTTAGCYTEALEE